MRIPTATLRPMAPLALLTALLSISPVAHARPAVAAALVAQDRLVITAGDPMPGFPGESILGAANYVVNSSGDWAAVVSAQVNVPPEPRQRLLMNGQVVFGVGDTLPGGFVVRELNTLDLSESGGLLARATVESVGSGMYSSAVIYDGQVLMVRGTPLVGGSVPPGASIFRIERAFLDGDRRILAIVRDRPGIGPQGSALVELPLTPIPGAPRVLLRTGDVFEDGRELGELKALRVSASGLVMTAVMDRAPGSAVFTPTIRVDGSPVLRAGDASPIPGLDWSFSAFLIYQRRFDINDAAELMINLELAPGSNERAIARGKSLILRRGEAPSGSPLTPIQWISSTSSSITNHGAIVWYGQDTLGDNGLYIDGRPIVKAGLGAAGSVIASTVQASGDFIIQPVSRSGGYLLHHVRLADGREGLWLRDLSIGRESCAPTAHSGGVSARLSISGSDLAGGQPLELTASELPAFQPGYFLIGSRAASFSLPGSAATFCVGGSVARFPSPFNSGATGSANIQVDTLALPLAQSPAVLAGQTWHFQAWFRDTLPAAPFNVTNSVVVRFR